MENTSEYNGEKEQEQASEPLDHSTVWLWKRRGKGRRIVYGDKDLVRLMESTRNKVFYHRRPVLGRDCPPLASLLCEVISWEQSGVGYFYWKCFVGSWKCGSCRLSGNNSPHIRLSLDGRSQGSTAMAVTGKFQSL